MNNHYHVKNEIFQNFCQKKKILRKLNADLKLKTDYYVIIKYVSIINFYFLDETLKLGYTQRPWEDTDHLVKRISKDNRSVVEGELLKVFL